MNKKQIVKTLSKIDARIQDWPRKKVVLSILWGVILLLISLVINFIAGSYASSHADHGVRDLILDNVPTLDVSFIFIYGIAAFFGIIGFLMIQRPKRAPFILMTLSLFIIFRSFFIVLTHLGPSPELTNFSLNNFVSYFTFTGDLFFSAHTGMPFLMALIFWKHFKLRIFFICTSIFFAITVLLGHLHYSIDVFSAFFITYGIYKIAKHIFNDEYNLLNSIKS